MDTRYLIVVSEQDPVAPAVARGWGVPPSTGEFVGGAAVRSLRPDVLVVRRPGLHIHDDGLTHEIPAALRDPPVPLVFPSVHRSESGTPCLTVHPIGNLGPEADVGGRPYHLAPTAPRLMASALRSLAEHGDRLGLPATYEATHHGPAVDHPCMFVEIGFGSGDTPPEEAVAALGRLLPDLVEDPSDRVVLGIGGGHYVPHLTELALTRRWAFGHLVSRHGFASAPRALLAEALEKSPGAEGIVYARTADAEEVKVQGLGRRLRESEAPKRGPAAA